MQLNYVSKRDRRDENIIMEMEAIWVLVESRGGGGGEHSRVKVKRFDLIESTVFLKCALSVRVWAYLMLCFLLLYYYPELVKGN